MMDKNFVNTKEYLFAEGIKRLYDFCKVNNLEVPGITVSNPDNWVFNACAYYRPTYIYINLKKCSNACGELRSRNWNWPGSTTDRTPYGVLAHELGHYVDMQLSDVTYSYSGDYSENLEKKLKIKSITSYCPNHAEWFAELFRLFVTNHSLLKILRPQIHKELSKRFKPVSNSNWKIELGKKCPKRIIANLNNKIPSRSRKKK